MSVGPNLITTLVRAQDGVTTRTYNINVNRASAATVTTEPAVVIDASRATLNGAANPNGVSTVYFEYGTTPDFGSRTPDRDISGTTSRAFAASLTGLSGATTYHYRAVLFNAAGTIIGSTRQFTTVPNPPVAATGAPSNVTSSTATLVGAVNPNGVQASVYFEYGLTTAYGQSTPVQKIPAGFSTISVQAPNLPLIPNAAYHYRLVASNSAGTALGNDVLFTVVGRRRQRQRRPHRRSERGHRNRLWHRHRIRHPSGNRQSERRHHPREIRIRTHSRATAPPPPSRASATATRPCRWRSRSKACCRERPITSA